MLRIERILGSRAEPAISARLHDLDHRGAVEIVAVPVDDLARRRLVARTEAGEAVAIALPREQKLFDGAVLLLDADRALVVRAGEERWLRLAPRSAADALELGYHAGNLHWRVRFEGVELLVALDGPAADHLARIAPLIAAGRVEVVAS